MHFIPPANPKAGFDSHETSSDVELGVYLARKGIRVKS